MKERSLNFFDLLSFLIKAKTLYVRSLKLTLFSGGFEPFCLTRTYCRRFVLSNEHFFCYMLCKKEESFHVLLENYAFWKLRKVAEYLHSAAFLDLKQHYFLVVYGKSTYFNLQSCKVNSRSQTNVKQSNGAYRIFSRLIFFQSGAAYHFFFGRVSYIKLKFFHSRLIGGVLHTSHHFA